MPRGTPFTPETARAAARKSAEARAARKSVAGALLARMQEEFVDPETGEVVTGAEAVAAAMLRDATSGDFRRGNVKMMELLLGLIGEAPEVRIAASIRSGEIAGPTAVQELERLSDAELCELIDKERAAETQEQTQAQIQAATGKHM